MIVKSCHRPYIYFLFRDDNTEITFFKRPGVPPKNRGDMKLRTKDKELIKEYFK